MLELHTVNRLSSFSEVISILKATDQYERVFHHVVDRIVRLFNCQTCAVVLIDLKTEYLRIDNSFGLSYTFCKAFRKTLATGAVGELLWTGRPIVITDSSRQDELARQVRLEHPFGSCVCFQISSHLRPAGYLHLDFADIQVPDEEGMRLLQSFADVAGIALYKNQLYEENLRLDRMDHETGLLKYGPCVETLRLMVEKAKDSNEQLSLMILDVDNYKSIVNTYGYEASREFLNEFGTLVQSHLRGIDVGGRYGRDEIMIILPHTGVIDADENAKRLRLRIEQSPFTKSGISSTVSIGVAEYPRNATSMEELVLAAKEALFEAQRSGRNVVFQYKHQTSGREL